MSHKTVWCPLRDIKALLKGGQANASLLHNGDIPFYQCAALHYLCRPTELDDLSVYDFFSMYEVVRQTKYTQADLLDFDNTTFQHPSYHSKTKKFLQGVRERSQMHLVKIFQYDFPDTSEFGGSLLDENIPISESMEIYCELVLLLFYPYRNLDDITHNEYFTETFREAVKSGIIGNQALQFLQNAQDARSNSLRIPRLVDDLQRNTNPFQPEGDMMKIMMIRTMMMLNHWKDQS
jgi:hypothetical protein